MLSIPAKLQLVLWMIGAWLFVADNPANAALKLVFAQAHPMQISKVIEGPVDKDHPDGTQAPQVAAYGFNIKHGQSCWTS